VAEVMKWDVQIKNVNSKLVRSYYLMQSLEGIRSVNILRSLYFVNFHLHIRYGILFWGEVMGKLKRKKNHKRKLSD